MPIFIIVPKGTVVLAAYTDEALALTHARTITGAEVVDTELLTKLAPQARDDVNEFDQYDGDDLTPVVEIKEPKV